YAPNAQAALRLVEQIMPRVRQQHPDACAWIVGQGPSAELRAKHDGAAVVVTGEVVDVRPYLAAAAVSCVPLLAGSGTKYRVLEAWSAGVPVVGPPRGGGGWGLVVGPPLWVGRPDAVLADGVGRFLWDGVLAARLAVRGRQQLERFYAGDVNLSRL